MSNILSIDFDYFQKTDPDIIKYHYPDGIDLPAELTEVTWGSRYGQYEAQTGKTMESAVYADWSIMEQVRDVIFECTDVDVPVMVEGSHRMLFPFLSYLDMNGVPVKDARIVNLDMHHDLFDDGTLVGCGNWAYHANSKYGITVDWVMHPASRELLLKDDMRTKQIRKLHKKIMKNHNDFDFINSMHFDAVFICRSDTWTPPHLDEAFHEFYAEIISGRMNCIVEDDVIKERNMESVDSMRKLVLHMYGKTMDGEGCV